MQPRLKIYHASSPLGRALSARPAGFQPAPGRLEALQMEHPTSALATASTGTCHHFALQEAVSYCSKCGRTECCLANSVRFAHIDLSVVEMRAGMLRFVYIYTTWSSHMEHSVFQGLHPQCRVYIAWAPQLLRSIRSTRPDSTRLLQLNGANQDDTHHYHSMTGPRCTSAPCLLPQAGI